MNSEPNQKPKRQKPIVETIHVTPATLAENMAETLNRYFGKGSFVSVKWIETQTKAGRIIWPASGATFESEV